MHQVLQKKCTRVLLQNVVRMTKVIQKLGHHASTLCCVGGGNSEHGFFKLQWNLTIGQKGCKPNKTSWNIPLTCSLGCFTKHFIEKICYKMVLRQPTSGQQVGTLYEMTSLSVISMKCFSADDACAKTRSATSGKNPVILFKMLLQSRCCLRSAAPIWQSICL